MNKGVGTRSCLWIDECIRLFSVHGKFVQVCDRRDHCWLHRSVHTIASIHSVISLTFMVAIGITECMTWTMESFWLGETLIYLIHVPMEEHGIDLTKYVFNTEAHPTRTLPEVRKAIAEAKARL